MLLPHAEAWMHKDKMKRKCKNNDFLPFFSLWLAIKEKIMRYMIHNLEYGIITSLMPFIYDDEVTLEGISEAIKKRRIERFPLPCGYNPLPQNSDCILLCEYADYDSYEEKPVQNVAQMAMGYSGCIAVFTMKDKVLTEMREPRQTEKEICNQAHEFYFVPKLKKYRKNGENKNGE